MKLFFLLVMIYLLFVLGAFIAIYYQTYVACARAYGSNWQKYNSDPPMCESSDGQLKDYPTFQLIMR